MGVRVVEADSASDSYDDEDCAHCNADAKTKTKAKGAYFKHSAPKETHDKLNDSAVKVLVGNFKEYRIENNCRNLRVIGNGNRIRISENSGSLQIIGNSTRLKIQSNNAHIQYTGNDGRIYLGNESKQQTVDYIGCNGILKLVKAMQMHSSKCKAKKEPDQKHNESNHSSRLGLDKSIEIKSNLTVVNCVGGNIVVNNAINLSI